MEQRIATLAKKLLVGKRLKMSLTDNKTSELWHSFMVQRKALTNTVGADMYSMQLYAPGYFDAFNPAAEFEKWAAVEVASFDAVPEGMEPFLLPGGLYSVFLHKGPASDGPVSFRYILGTWLPASGYELDERPHFEILGPKYKNNEPDSEEEIWIPIRKKG